MSRFKVWRSALLLLGWAAVCTAAEPVSCLLRWDAAQPRSYHERLTGVGSLLRGAGGRNQQLDLDVQAENRRDWRCEDSSGQGFMLAAVSSGSSSQLRLGDTVWRETRAWRGFRLRVTPQGGILNAEVLPTAEPADAQSPAKTADAETFQQLPFDLDLGEMFSLVELGLLPPRPAAPGERWQLGGTTQPWRVEGRLIEVVTEGADKHTVAVFETAFTTPVPERATAVSDIVVAAALSGTVRVRFDVAAGRVDHAEGPLDLTLTFRRRNDTQSLATVALKLNLVVDRDAKSG